MSDVRLEGCRPEPLASYLKALGLLRLVAEQTDPLARGRWDEDRFVLTSDLGEEELIAFLAERYRPTPVVTPWNGGSGFHPKDNKSGIDPIEQSTDPRFQDYREAIVACRQVLTRLGLSEKPGKSEKAALLQALRSHLPDRALEWLDAAVVVSGDDPQYPPLLGTGGNDGRLEFANNQMQRLESLLLAAGRKALPTAALARSALLGRPLPGMQKVPIGQFDPAGAGGSNQGQGFDGSAQANPWDYVLMIEGAMTLAGAATRRFEVSEPGTLSFPFSVRAVGAGYASATAADEGDSRHELWLPLWGDPSTWSELRALFSEGRAKVPGSNHAARTGTDFARAVASLGVDRGVDAFVRFAFHVRNGLSYLAVPLGRWQVRPVGRVHLLTDLDRWLDRARLASRSHVPASFVSALRQVEEAVLELCARGDAASAQRVLMRVASADAVVARSPKLRESVPPVPPLHGRWVSAADDDTVEFRLAVNLASTSLRRRMVPLDPKSPSRWARADDPGVVWMDTDLVRNLLAVARRQDVEAKEAQGSPIAGARPAQLDDVSAFVEGEVDDHRLASLLVALSLVGWAPTSSGNQREPRPPLRQPPALFAALALVWHRYLEQEDQPTPPRVAGLVAVGAAGQGERACQLAVQRLRGSGQPVLLKPFPTDATTARRATAALCFPLTRRTLARLARPLRPRPDPFTTQEETDDVRP